MLRVAALFHRAAVWAPPKTSGEASKVFDNAYDFDRIRITYPYPGTFTQPVIDQG